MRSSPQQRALSYAYYDLLLQTGRSREVITELELRLRNTQDDPHLYELQARAFEASGQRIAQHRAQAEAYFRRGNLGAAVEQLEIAVKTKSDDFYQLSSAESRLRELRAQLENEKAAEKALKIS
jgi:predicted Zn-dependent protease